jgi:DNA polymerase-3 subunit delta'
MHKKTRAQVKAILTRPPQTILIVGVAGSGKQALARHLAANLLNTAIEKLDQHPYFIRIDKPEGKREITIESIRDLVRAVGLKSNASGGRANRVVLISEADSLSHQAQNALLKIIEEPPERTVFLLCAASPQSLLPTIASRAQKLAVNALSLGDSIKFFDASYPAKDITSAWSLSQGSAGLLAALLEGEDDHPLKKSVEKSKDFLKMDSFQRLIYLDSLSGDKESLEMLLDGLARVLKELHKAAIAKGSSRHADKLIQSRRLVNDARASLAKNSAGRLVGLNLTLKLPL